MPPAHDPFSPADGLDTSRPGVRPIIAILAEQARAESDNTSWRVGQWHLHNRRHGVWNQQRPYGYVVDENGHLKPHPTEAPIVRRMKDDFLGGASLRGIARWLNDEGIKPPGVVHAEDARAAGRRAKGPLGDSWYATTVRKVLSQPAIAALVSHNRKLLYDEHGEPISAGEGIATMAERARILAELERRSIVAQKGSVDRVGKRTGAGRPAEHLLVGFVRCGECGGAAVRQPSKGVHAFRCARKRDGARCRGAQIAEKYLNRGGDRQANAALHRIVVVRLRWHQPTKDYMTRRLAQGKTKREIIRCLKRYVAREVFAALHQLGQDAPTAIA